MKNEYLTPLWLQKLYCKLHLHNWATVFGKTYCVYCKKVKP